MTSLSSVPGLDVRRQSVVEIAGAEVAVARVQAGNRLAAIAPSIPGALRDLEGETSSFDGQSLLVGPLSVHNLSVLQRVLPWLVPQPLGLARSFGFGDRLGFATAGHIRALREAGPGLAPIFAQQSIREMERTGRNPAQVLTDAAWGVFADAWRDGYGADADHLKTAADAGVRPGALFRQGQVFP